MSQKRPRSREGSYEARRDYRRNFDDRREVSRDRGYDREPGFDNRRGDGGYGRDRRDDRDVGRRFDDRRDERRFDDRRDERRYDDRRDDRRYDDRRDARRFDERRDDRRSDDRRDDRRDNRQFDPPRNYGEDNKLAVAVRARNDYHLKSYRPVMAPGQRVAAHGSVKVNYFALQFPRDLVVYHYDVTIMGVKNLDKISRPVVRQMVNAALASLEEKREKRENDAGLPFYFAYDGVKNLYTLERGYDKLGKERTVDASIEEGRRPTNFSVKFKKVATLDGHQLNSFINRVSVDFPQDIINVFDILLQQHPLSMKNFMSTRSSVFINITRGFGELKGGMVLYKGMRSSIRPGTGQAFVNIDNASAVFFPTGDLLDIADKFLRDTCRFNGSLRNLNQPLGRREMKEFEKHIKGLLAHVTHRPSSRPYKIKKLSDRPAGQITFPIEGSQKEVSVVEYFYEQFKIRLNKYLPCIVTGSDKRPVHLPLEVCKLIEKSPYPISRLRDEHIGEMIKYTRENPKERQEIIMNNRNTLANDNPFLETWGVSIAKEMVSAPAIVMQPPALRYGNSNRTVSPNNGVWRFDQETFASASSLGSDYAVLVLADIPQFDDRAVSSLIQDFIRQGQRHGLNAGEPALVRRLGLLRLDDVKPALMDILQEVRRQLQLLVIVLPNDKHMDLYKEIKYHATTDLSIATQCINGFKARGQHGPRAMQYWSNVFLKINPKLGGHILDMSFPPFVQEHDLFVGVDISHGTSRPNEPSIAVAVANIDKVRGRYPAALRLFTGDRSNRELITVLGSMIVELIRMYQANNDKALPSRIFLYRDGVSEGQFAETRRVELESVRRSLLEAFGHDYKPKLVFVVCSKRHRLRIFPENESIRDKNGNVAAGTLVNTVVTVPNGSKSEVSGGKSTAIIHNFILASHASIIGTTRPTRYYVLEDEIGMSPEQFEDLTHALCYSYARCSRAVSLPAPAYYADICAEKAWAFVRTKPDGTTALKPIAEGLKETMWYL